MVLIKIALALILLGAITMMFAVLNARKLLQLLKKGRQELKAWKILLLFMLFFLAGYVASAYFISAGLDKELILITGTVFFFGALFVYIITRVSTNTIGDLINKNDERRKVGLELLERETRLLKLNRALLLLTKKLKESEGNYFSTIRNITEISAETINVERVSVWLYDDLKSGIQCVNLFEKNKNKHSEGIFLVAKDYPEYFKALEEDRVVDAHDARKDPRTREFSETYLKPLGITSMLDAPVRTAGKTIGVLCIEHTGAMRSWNAEEQSFARSMADAVALEIETSERKRMEDEIRSLNLELEKRVKERTAELTNSNKNLLQEIFRREEIEKALLESEEKYRTILEDVSDVVYTSDYKGYFTYINPACVKLTGFTQKEMVGKHFSELIHPKWKEEVASFYLKQFKNRIDETLFSFPIITKSGAQKWVEQTVKQIRDGDRILEHQSVVRDITKRRKAEDELKESEEKIKTILQCAPEAVILINHESVIKDWNPFAEKIFGWKKEEIIEKHLYDTIIPQRLREAHKQGLKKYLATGEEKVFNHPVELPGLRKDGTEFEVGINISPLVFRGEKFFIGFLTDITPRKKADAELNKKSEELINSNRELEQFAYIASHDLQEPLRMVSSYVQLLEMRYKDKLDADANDFIHFAMDGSNRMRKLINSLLEYSRVNRIKPFEKIKTNLLLENVLLDLKEAINESKAGIKIGTLPDIIGDPVLISQLFQNLIGNAVKFRSDKTPSIIISGKANNGDLLFSVKDNGIGISREYFNKIFVIFQRLHSKEKYPGTGIGLAICKKIVERHGGKIWVESEEGGGSTFYFTLKGKL